MLRSVQKAFDMIHEEDPGSAVSLYMIRLWCKEGKVKSLNVGTKILVDYESLKNYISFAGSEDVEEQTGCLTLR